MATSSIKFKIKKILFLFLIVVVLVAVVSYCIIVNHLFVKIDGDITISTVKSYEISGSNVSNEDLKNLKYLKNSITYIFLHPKSQILSLLVK